MFNAKLIQDPDNELEFVLWLEDVKPDTNPDVRVRLLDGSKFFIPLYSGSVLLPVEFSVPAEPDAPVRAWVRFTLSGLLDKCGATNLNSRVCEFLLKDGDREEFVAWEENASPLEIKTTRLSYTLCPGSGRNLVLRLNWNEQRIPCEMTLREEDLRVRLETSHPGELVLCHRIERDTVRFDGRICYAGHGQNEYRISYRELIGLTTTDSDLFSLYFRLPANSAAPSFFCRVVTEQESEKYMLPGHQITAFKIKDQTASIEVRRNWDMTPVKVEVLENAAAFCPNDLACDAIKLRQIISFPASQDGPARKLIQPDAWVFPGNQIPLDTWQQLRPRNDLIFQVVAQIQGSEHRLTAAEPWEHTWELDLQTVTLTGSEKGFTLRVSQKANKIRLGILGTCMTRWAFSRKYTDAYRSLYDVTFAHFWPSAFSLMEEPIPFPEERYAEYPEQEQSFVRREYEKTSLKELEEARCEYVLLDFFVDAIHGPRRMKDGKFIGYKAYAKDFYQDYLLFDSEKYFMDTNGYFEAWTKYADRLIDELKRIIPENRIVLATGGLTHYFLSEDGQIKCFDGKTLKGSYMTKHSINGLNYLWDRMNAYFIGKLPGAQVLDMRQYSFLAHDRNPGDVRPYHYQNGYYRAMSAELSRIVLWDRQNP